MLRDGAFDVILAVYSLEERGATLTSHAIAPGAKDADGDNIGVEALRA